MQESFICTLHIGGVGWASSLIPTGLKTLPQLSNSIEEITEFPQQNHQPFHHDPSRTAQKSQYQATKPHPNSEHGINCKEMPENQ